jgi:hypothetical protein
MHVKSPSSKLLMKISQKQICVRCYEKETKLKFNTQMKQMYKNKARTWSNQSHRCQDEKKMDHTDN